MVKKQGSRQRMNDDEIAVNVIELQTLEILAGDSGFYLFVESFSNRYN
jgi:hypothetical protein